LAHENFGNTEQKKDRLLERAYYYNTRIWIWNSGYAASMYI